MRPSSAAIRIQTRHGGGGGGGRRVSAEIEARKRAAAANLHGERRAVGAFAFAPEAGVGPRFENFASRGKQEQATGLVHGGRGGVMQADHDAASGLALRAEQGAAAQMALRGGAAEAVVLMEDRSYGGPVGGSVLSTVQGVVSRDGFITLPGTLNLCCQFLK